MTVQYNDPYIEEIFDELLKKDMKSLTPDDSSATWELIKTLYKKERRRRLKIVLLQVGLTLSAAVAVGTIFYSLIKQQNPNDDHQGSGI